MAPLPADSPARFPNGFYRIDYCLEGDLKTPELTAFERILDKAVVRKTGWPPIWIPTREAVQPREFDGLIECWLAPPGNQVERGFCDPAHCDFWRAAPSGPMFLIRGYQEDGAETFAPGTNVKVRRLFYWMAERQTYPWFAKLPEPEALDNLGLGSGNRVLVKGGRLDPKIPHNRPGGDVDTSSPYYRQVRLLTSILPLVAAEKMFALKGGTAINLFIRDLPRLSVDVDFIYLPMQIATQH